MKLKDMRTENRCMGHGLNITFEIERFKISEEWEMVLEHDNYFGKRTELSNDMIDKAIEFLKSIKEGE